MWRLVVMCAVTVHGMVENVNAKQDWWEAALIYKIYPRSFSDSDGDGVGDLKGITTKLEYLKGLGVDAAWLCPIFKSPMHDFGYDISDYYTIQPDYGTMDDFEQLLKKANELNIKIILDLVINHSSNESEWFLKSSTKDEFYSDWYIWENGHLDPSGHRSPPNNWISLFRKGAWTYSSNRDQFYFHQFGETQPDFNFRSPVVVDEMKSIIKFWLEKGVAGLMINTVNLLFESDKDQFGGIYPNEPITGEPGLTPDDYGYLKHIYTRDLEDSYEMVFQLRDVFEAITLRDNLTRVLMTEAYTGIKNAVRYYGEGVHPGSHIPLNFILMDQLCADSDARDVKNAVDFWMNYKPLKKPANWVIGNQDKSRVASRFRPELVDAFNMLILLLPGIAITYMGEEIGMRNGFVAWSETKDPLACNTDDPIHFVDVSRDPARTPFHWTSGKNAGFSYAEKTWLPVAEGYEHLNVASEKSAARSYYQVYIALTNLRMRPAFRLGRYESKSLNTDVFAIKRWYNDDSYIIVMNFGRTFRVVNLTVFDLIFGQLEVEASSVLSSRTYGDIVQAKLLDLAADEALVLRMVV